MYSFLLPLYPRALKSLYVPCLSMTLLLLLVKVTSLLVMTLTTT